MFEIIEKEEECGTIIKVFGVGGAGGNAIEHMIHEGVNGSTWGRLFVVAEPFHRRAIQPYRTSPNSIHS